ncbi:MAG: MCP four helix bundle domain-containing protein [Cyclobacteriaceae bacterium]|uniref:MCP four helix bundle domain-containing protein n=1 Tax=Algoriphagus marincola TaxID=264027 RepID=UPI000415B7AF|nr:MCP four helix bundle domain-containing protein [Algoriphagus marincola]MCR9084317.1 MCP four helix bundle domain-containing protein [Cyclobacteriaceae bacterium]
MSSIRRKKFQAFFIVSLLLLLIYAKNLIERQNFKEISSTFTEVYNDRLVVESYIFDISEGLFQIQKLVDHCDIDYDYSRVLDEIEQEENEILEIIEEFEKTKLTPDESQYLTDFKNIIVNDLSIKSYDLLYTDSSGVNIDQVKRYDAKISQARKDLDDLSAIQLDEGERLIKKAKRLINRSQIWAQFEVALLIILILVMFWLIFRKSKETKGVIS